MSYTMQSLRRLFSYRPGLGNIYDDAAACLKEVRGRSSASRIRMSFLIGRGADPESLKAGLNGLLPAGNDSIWSRRRYRN